jgi:hypothetical protein
VGILATIFTVYLILNGDFATNLDGWLAACHLGAPWGAIMLVYYYAIAKQEIDVNALFEPPGSPRVPDVVWEAIIPVPDRHRGDLDVRVRHPVLSPGSGPPSTSAGSTCPGWRVPSWPVSSRTSRCRGATAAAAPALGAEGA